MVVRMQNKILLITLPSTILHGTNEKTTFSSRSSRFNSLNTILHKVVWVPAKLLCLLIHNYMWFCQFNLSFLLGKEDEGLTTAELVRVLFVMYAFFLESICQRWARYKHKFQWIILVIWCIWYNYSSINQMSHSIHTFYYISTNIYYTMHLYSYSF